MTPNARIHPFAAALVAEGIKTFRAHRLEYGQLISRTREQLTEAGFPPVPVPPLAEQSPPVIPVLTNRAFALLDFCQTQGWNVEKCCRKPLVSLPTVTKRVYLPALRQLGLPSQKINVRYACDEYPQASACTQSLYLVHPVMKS